jgi:hypothetical protein
MKRTSSPFKWQHYAPDVILLCVRWYCRYSLSYRDLEEMMRERGLPVDHVTIFRWVQRYAPEINRRMRTHLKMSGTSYRLAKVSSASPHSQGPLSTPVCLKSVFPTQPRRQTASGVCSTPPKIGSAPATLPTSSGTRTSACGSTAATWGRSIGRRGREGPGKNTGMPRRRLPRLTT